MNTESCIDTRVPWGIKICGLLPFKLSQSKRLLVYRSTVLLLTFLAYVFYNVARKSISVVKTELVVCNETITIDIDETVSKAQEPVCSSWIDAMDCQSKSEAKRLEGALDSAFLFSYAFFKFASGFIAEHMNLRYFLTMGMFLSGVFSILFGLAFYIDMHSFAYFIVMQVFAGAFQSSGWPGVVTAIGHWFEKGKKGFIMGVWGSNNAVGNILGSIIAGAWVEDEWGMSFIVPGVILASFSFVVWFLLVPVPEHVGLTIKGKKEIKDEEQIPDVPSAVKKEKSIGFLGALKIPGVIEFALCFFFTKLIAYTFLYWLPTFIKEKGVEGKVTGEDAAYLSTIFDVGGMIGGIVAGFITDRTGKPAITCAFLLMTAIPILFAYNEFGDSCPLNSEDKNNCYWGNVGLLFIGGLLIYGPYSLISSAVAAELGTHPSLQGSSKNLFMVTAIIDGTGSIGASIGPFITGAIEGLENGLTWTFVMLMCANVCALLLLSRLLYKEVRNAITNRRRKTKLVFKDTSD